ncbi:hypothetical protein B0T14DRAFT_512660 [Immersiella caudata]|uniref:DUF4238 domain-containing protein n=1 Tax=Immersiella caudata TaxID=314043 RepID=A0AA40C7W1_9PEZI|nr:hypothetical protein B0T14DRAFT_512660 [Immersiella caudata]
MATSTKPEYQHFVPQFLLRNFAHPYKPAGVRKRGKRKDENGIYYNELVVRNVDLSADPPVICEKPVKRVLGEMNMYEKDDDASHAPDLGSSKTRRSLEQMLGQLENKVVAVFQKITNTYKEDVKNKAEGSDFGPACVELTRAERDLIRKFLFILKYRGRRFRQRFNHDSAESYEENDREIFLEYMTEKGYTRPLDVWHDNIKAIIEVDMDTEGLWRRELPKRMYPMDAQWFISHTGFYYMTICTPSSPDEEFVLTDNSYNVFEGPNTFVRDWQGGQVQPSYHVPLHKFAPVSPKLMIVLRSMTFPNPLEDADEATRRWRALRRKVVLEDFYGPEMSKSLLDDLPVTKARNNYSQIIGNRGEPIDCDIGFKRQKSHKFYFTIFPLPSKYVHTINTVLFDNASYCKSIIFNETTAFIKTLEWFLTAPSSTAKTVLGYDDDARKKLFDKLEVIARSLGSEKEMTRGYLRVPLMQGDYDGFMKWNDQKHRLIRDMNLGKRNSHRNNSRSPKPDFRGLYEDLGGTKGSMANDFDQAERMWILRVKIDSWSHGVDESIRQRNRNLLNEAYCRVPPARYFVFSKLSQIEITAIELPKDREPKIDVEGPEDIIARAQHIVRRDKINGLIHNAMQSYAKRQGRSRSQDMWKKFTPDFEGFKKLRSISFMVEESGYIRDCGIPEVEDLARQAQRRILRENLQNDDSLAYSSIAFLKEDVRIELLTRALVKVDFATLLKGKVEASLLHGLEGVLFDLAYPTPPDKKASPK